jgi:2-aminoadipate transaminase
MPVSSAEVRESMYNFARRMSLVGTSAVREILKVAGKPDVISFAGGLPAAETFPVSELARAHAELFAEEGRAAMQYSITEGWLPLREWIASRMRLKGIDADPSRVLITTGSQQGIDLVGKAFIDAGDKVLVESPSYLAALHSFSIYEASFVTVGSDEQGMNVDEVERILRKDRPKLIYTVPDFQNPCGTTLSLDRRKQLLQLAEKYRVPILEDDPYGELRYTGERVPSLAALDKSGTVIHLSTFSKTLSPGIRLGWAIASGEISHSLIVAKQSSDLHSNSISQRAVARMLQSFDYDGHVQSICALYRERCTAMLAALERYFPEGSHWTHPEGGLFIWVELPGGLNAAELLEEALARHVAFVPGAPFFAGSPRHNFMRLNFSDRPPEMIEVGIQRIGEIAKRRLGK